MAETTMIEKVAMLRDYFVREQTSNPFSAGDIVTSRRSSPSRYAGQPFIVLETDINIDLHVPGNDDAYSFGAAFRPTMRVACVKDGPDGASVLPFLAAHAEYIAWDERDSDGTTTTTPAAYLVAKVGDKVLLDDKAGNGLAGKTVIVVDVDPSDVAPVDGFRLRVHAEGTDPDEDGCWIANCHVVSIVEAA